MIRQHARASVAPVLLALLAWSAAGCATYSERVMGARAAADFGDYGAAVAAIDPVVGASAEDAPPDALSGDQALALLERGVLLQAQQRFRESARDLSAAEEALELLDLRLDAIGPLGEYIYSDSAGIYKAPPSERLALNSLNMLNYLALGDLNGAAVEARRYTVMREYLTSSGVDTGRGLGAFLAGFTFEQLGQGQRALRYYREALEAGADPEALAEPVARLKSGRSARNDRSGLGEILVVVCQGRVPYKRPERMPIGAAIGYAGAYVSGDPRWLSRGVTKVVVYPELTDGEFREGPWRAGGGTGFAARLRIDGRPQATLLVDDFAAAIRREYRDLKPRILGAAVSRLIARAAAAEGARSLGRKEEAWLGELLAIALEGTLVALDRPDTRSWTLLPARARIARVLVRAGTHELSVDLPGEKTRQIQVDVAERGFAAVVVTAPRWPGN